MRNGWYKVVQIDFAVVRHTLERTYRNLLTKESAEKILARQIIRLIAVVFCRAKSSHKCPFNTVAPGGNGGEDYNKYF